ncbi:TadE/TadG family type IV pilus assembly protein [Demequina sp. SYSU T00192]|uniref:TadE/TadG family type IV pilus assembly protein n=1 Tax=Demequina litoralis TaxID=3051660 RepID=A0ABT8GBW7_9MICO|nr:TadE/TadG family type IV pilus assembly protein [Demequina sp. SYSU T00192]MDN4476628.1 TadE/TadG family type IV pilus assembly protein [Demequina sp. SYSU T00192]
MSPSRAADEGSAVVELVLVAVLVVAVALGVLQVALAAHVRSTLTACASEGARVVAVARQGDDAGAARAAACAEASLGLGTVVAVAREDLGGRPAVRVTVTGDAPVLLWSAGTVEASGRALLEGADGA